MTNKEAIEMLNVCIRGTDILNYKELKDALTLAIQALEAQAEKERRYVVEEYHHLRSTYCFRVRRATTQVVVAGSITNREAAQAIADIYEGMDNE